MDLIRKHNLKVARIALCAVLSLLAVPAAAQSSNQPADWQFSLTPYLWFPTVKSTAQYTLPAGIGGGTATVEKDADDYLSKLDMGAMLTFEARKGRWAIISDFIYLDFSDDSASVKTLSGPGGAVQVPVNAGTQSGLEGGVWQLAASYALSRSTTSTFEALGGLRYAKFEAKVDWQLAGSLGLFPQAGSLTQTEELVDAIIGVRGKAKLGGGNWFVPWYLDAGAGDSKLTWQAEAGIGYSFKWGDVLLAWRHLYYEQKSDKPVQEWNGRPGSRRNLPVLGTVGFKLPQQRLCGALMLIALVAVPGACFAADSAAGPQEPGAGAAAMKAEADSRRWPRSSLRSRSWRRPGGDCAASLPTRHACARWLRTSTKSRRRSPAHGGWRAT